MVQHILAVEDDALMRRSLSLMLEEAGYRTSTSASAEDALALAPRAAPDLILLDVGLPGMDGLAARRELRMNGAVPVVFVSARRRDLDTILGLKLGADSYITKPFHPMCCSQILNRCCGVASAHQRHHSLRESKRAILLSIP